MRTLVFSAIAALALATAPALAAPTHHTTTHRTVHTTSHRSHGTTHTTRRVTTHRATRTTHTGTRNSHRTGWHGRTGRNSGRGNGVHLSVNIGGLHANINSPRRYHYSGAWNRPSGWHAQRWAYGQRLPGGWYARDYWLNDYVSFGLVAPPDGYAWIREGDDAVLVDTNTGEIVRVEYNVFY